MKTANIQFLEKLQTELNTQPNDGNANPLFWVVAQNEWKSCWEEQAQEVWYCDNDGSERAKTLEEFKTVLIEDSYYDSEGNFIGDLKKWEDRADFGLDNVDDFDDFPSEIKGEYYEVPMREEHVIIQDTFFLTKRECQEHIERNQYHYNDTVHTYAMTAWRSPQYEQLINILKTEHFGDAK